MKQPPINTDEHRAELVALLFRELADLVREVQTAAEQIRVGLILNRNEIESHPERTEAALRDLMTIREPVVDARDLLRSVLLGVAE